MRYLFAIGLVVILLSIVVRLFEEARHLLLSYGLGDSEELPELTRFRVLTFVGLIAGALAVITSWVLYATGQLGW